MKKNKSFVSKLQLLFYKTNSVDKNDEFTPIIRNSKKLLKKTALKLAKKVNKHQFQIMFS